MTKDPRTDVASPDVLIRQPRELDVPTPGKASRTDGKSGNPAYDTDPLCHGLQGVYPGCTLDDRTRDRVLADIGRNSITVATNQKLACMKCESAILATRAPDLEIIPSLMLGALGIVFGSVITPLVGKVVEAAGVAVAPPTLGAVTRLPLTFYAGKLGNALRIREDANMKLQMLIHVQTTVDAAMRGLMFHAAQHLTDDALVVLATALEPERHTTEMYREALTAMLDRLMASGVAHIGRGAGPMRPNPGHRDDSRGHEDCRVVWVKVEGDEPVLFYQHVDASYDGDPRRHAQAQGTFGEMADPDRRLGAATIGKPVPIEFYGAAVAQHVAKWGPVIPTITDATSVQTARRELDKDIVQAARGGRP